MMTPRFAKNALIRAAFVLTIRANLDGVPDFSACQFSRDQIGQAFVDSRI